jgi:chaperone modulatory protein CbpM
MTLIESTAMELLDGTVTLVELCAYTQLSQRDVAVMIDIGLLEPIEIKASTQFSARDLRRAQIAKRLMRDLNVNLDGAAMILELLDERDTLHSRINMLEKLLTP